MSARTTLKFAFGVGAALLLLELLAPAAAFAQRRVVVERFRGPQSSRLRNNLVSNLGDVEGIELVPESDARASARELGIRRRRLQQDDYPQVAQALNVAAFISGTARRRGRRWVLTVTVRSGADGTSLGTATWSGRTISALSAIRRNGWERISQYVEMTQAPTPPPPPEPEQAWYDQEAEPDPTQNFDLEEPEEPVDSERAYDALRLGLTLGTNRRSMNTIALIDPARRGAPAGALPLEEERVYESGGLGHLEVGFSAELFPGAFLEGTPLPFLGLAVSYRHSVGLSSFGPACPLGTEPNGPSGASRCTSDVPSVEVGTTQSELYIGARFRYRLDELRRSPHVSADLGYGMFQFILDPNDLLLLERNSIVAPMDYRYVNIGAGIDYGLVPTYLNVGLRAAYRLGLSVGDDAKRIWGTETSNIGGFLVGLDVRTEAPYIADGVFAMFTFEFFRFNTDFRGQTACSMPDAAGSCPSGDLWEPWPASPDLSENVTGGLQDTVTDNYIRLQLTLGYAFRRGTSSASSDDYNGEAPVWGDGSDGGDADGDAMDNETPPDNEWPPRN